MARWKLTEPHYLNVPGTEWEQVTTDRTTQRPIRRKYKVPLFLDPRIETDWNYRDRLNPMDGEIHVCYADRGLPHDIVFEGDPTPGMLPLDDEAREISAKFSWQPTQGLDDQAQEASNQSRILNSLIKQLADATVAGQSAPAGFDKFMEAMASMMSQQTKLLEAILTKQADAEFERQAKAIGAEPPVADNALDDAEAPTEAELKASAKRAAEADKASIQRALDRAASRRV
jgi:hypothetical protein